MKPRIIKTACLLLLCSLLSTRLSASDKPRISPQEAQKRSEKEVRRERKQQEKMSKRALKAQKKQIRKARKQDQKATRALYKHRTS